jgi:hypothetical protein
MLQKNTQQELLPITSIKKSITNYRSVHVRWPAKNSGAFVFGCLFLCFFLLGKQKKEIQ